MNVQFDYAKLRGFITEHFGNVENFTKFLGISGTAMYDKLGNRTPFTQREIDKVASHSIKNRKLTAEEVSTLFFTHKIRKTV